MNSEMRCNSEPDCSDRSDEIGCNRLSLDKAYQKFISPPVLQQEINGFLYLIIIFAR